MSKLFDKANRNILILIDGMVSFKKESYEVQNCCVGWMQKHRPEDCGRCGICKYEYLQEYREQLKTRYLLKETDDV